MTLLPFPPLLPEDDDSLDWQQDTVCGQVDPDAWFPEPNEQAKAAKALCHTCPVRLRCLQYALDHEEPYGVWGGWSERQRRKARARANREGRTPIEVALDVEEEQRVEQARRERLRDHDDQMRTEQRRARRSA